MDDPFDLDRFVRAQESAYSQALSELRAGRKRSHWIWYIFPQLRGLGHSSMADRYGIASLAEASAYLGHDVLGPRLRECTATVLTHGDISIDRIMGYPDDLKFRSSMTLFAQAGEPADVFHQALGAFFNGQPDGMTLHLLE